jgi:uncharacterized protein YdhG (YjbR/CyaY superfamily)
MPPKSKIKAKPKTIDEYLAALSDDKRAALERLRKIIRAAAPGAEEHISYQLPAFRLDGKWLVWIGAAANHCAIYGVAGADADEIKDYDTSGRGTLRFQVDNPLPAPLVRKLVKARVAEIAAQQRQTGDVAARRR